MLVVIMIWLLQQFLLHLFCQSLLLCCYWTDSSYVSCSAEVYFLQKSKNLKGWIFIVLSSELDAKEARLSWKNLTLKVSTMDQLIMALKINRIVIYEPRSQNSKSWMPIETSCGSGIKIVHHIIVLVKIIEVWFTQIWQESLYVHCGFINYIKREIMKGNMTYMVYASSCLVKRSFSLWLLDLKKKIFEHKIQPLDVRRWKFGITHKKTHLILLFQEVSEWFLFYLSIFQSIETCFIYLAWNVSKEIFFLPQSII